MIPLLIWGAAQAATLHLGLELDAGSPRVVAAWLGPGHGAPLPVGGAGELELLDSEGRAVAKVPVDGLLRRSVVLPEGGGASAVLTDGVVWVRLHWPDDAAALRLGGQPVVPALAPPMPQAAAVLVQGEGTPAERLDLVFLGDGYTEAELPGFAADVQRVMDYLAGIEPYGAYTGLFNVWRVDLPSAESGASHPAEGDTRDTALGCAYDCGGLDRLICCDDYAVLSAVHAAVPEADGVLVLVNDSEYGGSGGFNYATAYNGQPLGVQVAAHELGHSLVGLWDEYSYGTSYSGSDGPNCTQDDQNLPWVEWSDEVGAWPVCSYTNYFRPTDSGCMMNTLQDGYCAVCRQEVVLALYRDLPGLLTAVEPAPGEVALRPGLTLEFGAEALGPDDGGLVWAWAVDGEVVGQGSRFSVEGCAPGHTLTLTVQDPTPWVREDPDGRLWDEVSWTLDRAACPADTAVDSGGGGEDRPRRCGCAYTPGGAGLLAGILALTLARRGRMRLS